MMLAPKVVARIELADGYLTRISSDSRGRRIVERVAIASVPELRPDSRLWVGLTCLLLAGAGLVAVLALT